MPRTIAFLNKKGGVGKTSTVHHLAGTLARRGLRCLLVDADPQASLTQGLLGPEVAEELDPRETIAAIFDESGAIPARSLVRPTAFNGLSLLPGSEAAEQYNDPNPWGSGMRQFVLRDAIAEASDGFDLVLIDCPPHIQLWAWSALVAAQGVVVPLQAEDYGAQGMKAIRRSIARVRADANASLVLVGYLVTMWNKALSVHRNLRELSAPTPRRRRVRIRRPAGQGLQGGRHVPQADRRIQAALRLGQGHRRPGRRVPGAARRPDPSRHRRITEGRLMASLKTDMFANIAGSMQDRPTIRGESMESAPAGRSAIERQSEGRKRLDNAAVIRVDRIIRDPNQPRTEFDPDALNRLAQSLRERGQLQPIRVRWNDAVSRYVVVIGERRWRAAQLAGLETLACVVVTGEPSPDDLLEDQLIENCLREDLKPIEQARAFKSLLATQNLSQRQLAERLQIGQATIAKALALLGLPETIQASVDAGEIGPDAAYQLTRIADPDEQAKLAREAAEGRLKRDELKERSSTPRKSRGGAKAKKITSRVFRSQTARVTIELRKGSGAEAIVAALREVLHQAEAELGTSGEQAAA